MIRKYARHTGFFDCPCPGCAGARQAREGRVVGTKSQRKLAKRKLV